MSEWQPIETAPKDGGPILVAGKRYVEIARWGSLFLNNGKEELYGWTLPGIVGSHLRDVTHWMPLPRPPL